jgi:hypothetical protein
MRLSWRKAMKIGNRLISLAVVLLLAVFSAPQAAWGGECCNPTTTPDVNNPPSTPVFTHSADPPATFSVTTSENDRTSTLTLSPPCNFNSTMESTDDSEVVAYERKPGGSLPPDYSFSGNSITGPLIDSTCEGPWGSVYRAKDNEDAYSGQSTVIFECVDETNQPPSRPSLEDGDTSQTSTCEFDLEFRSSDADGSVMSYILGGNVPDGYSINDSGVINGGPLSVNCSPLTADMYAPLTCRRTWDIWVRAKDNDCALGRKLNLTLRCTASLLNGVSN